MTASPAPRSVRTPVLDVAYSEAGPSDGEPVVLLHGFPYDPHAYDECVPPLAAAGCRVLVPYLRGYGPTRFLEPETPRSGQQAALAKDLLDFMDALGLARPTLVGYDWGGRAACIVAALWPERVQGLVTQGGYNVQNIAASAKPAPLACVSGVSGSNIKRRLEAIMNNRVGVQLGSAGKMMLALTALVALLLPVAVGALTKPRQAQALRRHHGRRGHPLRSRLRHR